MRLKDWSWLLLASALLFAGCGDDDKDTGKDQKGKSNSDSRGVFESDIDPKDPRVFRLTTASGDPLAGASVLIGLSDGVPFARNKLQTDAKGLFRAPAAWTSALPITVELSGYVRTTFMGQAPKGQVLRLEQEDSQARLEINGKATDFGNLRDGTVHFALILPLFNKSALTQFEMSMLLSPDMDEMSVLGNSIQLPSNLSLPDQKWGSFIPIGFGKPLYRTSVHKPGLFNFAAVHGRFDLSSVRKELNNGKSIFDVINSFEFMGAGTTAIAVTNTAVTKDIPVNQLTFNDAISFQAPAIQSGELVAAFGVIQEPGGLMISDLKRALSGATVRLKTTRDSKDKYVLSLLKKESKGTAVDFSQLSFALNPAKPGASVTPRFLALVQPPTLAGNVLTLFPPQPVTDVQDLGIYLSLVEIEPFVKDPLKTEIRTRLWEVLVPAWTTSVTLPSMQIVRNPKRTYRWEVMFLGQQGGSTSEDVFEKVTHISRHILEL